MTTVSPVVPGLNLREIVVAKSHDIYDPLISIKSEKGLLTTRWKFTWKERLFTLIFGYVTIQQITHNKGIQPMRPLARTVDYGDLTMDSCDYVELGPEPPSSIFPPIGLDQ